MARGGDGDGDGGGMKMTLSGGEALWEADSRLPITPRRPRAGGMERRGEGAAGYTSILS